MASADITRLERLINVTTPTPVFHRATGAVALASTLAPSQKFELLEVRLHLSAVGGAVGVVDFTATIDAIAGAAYDLLLLTQDMTAVSDYVYQPTMPLLFDEGDEIDFVYANGSSTTYGLTVIYQLIP